MKNDRPWTPEEIVAIQGPQDTVDIAKTLGRTPDSVRSKRREIRLRGHPEEASLPPGSVLLPTSPTKKSPWLDRIPGIGTPGSLEDPRTLASATLSRIDEIAKEVPPTYEQDKEKQGQEYWKQQYKTLEGKYDRALREDSVSAQLVALAGKLAPQGYSPLPKVAPRKKGDSSPQSAVLLLTDTHVGLVVNANQTLGFGKYDFDTFLDRLKFLEDGVISILRDHVGSEIPELVICLGGDMVDGALNHGAEVGQQVTLFQQFYGAGHALAQFIRNVAPHVPAIRIYCTQGNHTRWSNQHKMPTKNRYSNLDSFLYAYIQALTAALPTVAWTFDQQPAALFDVQGFLFQLFHGDVLRGGDKALGVPNHAVGRLVSTGSQLFGKYGKRSPDYYLCGHLHREIVLPTAKGAVIVGGGFPGLDGYGLASGFVPVDPSQTFFLVHPVYGKTATYNLALKFAKSSEVRPYDIPPNFDL